MPELYIADLDSSERRHLPSRWALLQQVRSAFMEQPGLSLTLAQARRLFGLEPETCQRLLGALLNERVLTVTPDGRYRTSEFW
jgi:DNA-binding IclR family transcriptional regulator